MNKFFTALCLGTLALSASAQAIQPAVQFSPDAQLPARAATADGFELRFCGAPTTFYQLDKSVSNSTYKMYIFINEGTASRLAGNKVTSISYGTYFTDATSKPGTVFIAEDLKNPIISQDVNIESLSETNKNPKTVDLNNTYTIKDGQGFYIGFTVTKCGSSASPICVDNTFATVSAGTAEQYDSNGALVASTDIGSALNKNLVIYANTVGEKNNLNDLLEIEDIFFPTYTIPVYEIGTEIPKIKVKFRNYGVNAVSKIEYQITTNGVASEPVEAKASVAVNKSVSKSYSIPTPVEGYNEYIFTITKINDSPCNISATRSLYYINPEEAIDRKFVVEKVTGTWCGYCPRGIWAVDQMLKKHPETFIPIDYHSNDRFSPAEIYTEFYSNISKNVGGVPASWINRDPNFYKSPALSTFEKIYDAWMADNKGFADLNLTVSYDNNGTITATAAPKFIISQENANYSLAFLLVENHLKGSQFNGYAGQGANCAAGDWGTYPENVSTTYNHTFRKAADEEITGIQGSVPTSIQKGTEYPYETKISTSGASNPTKCGVVALLLDNPTGVILNAALTWVDPKTGVDEVIVDENAPVEYYNLQGIRLAQPEPGTIVIRRQGNQVSKIVF